MKTLGYLGLGVMGYGMTGNLIDKSGCDIYGYDPVPALRERFAARGGKVLDDAKTLYKTCDIIFMCLPTNAIVKATITEIMETARPGTLNKSPSTSTRVLSPRPWRRASVRPVACRWNSMAPTSAIVCWKIRSTPYPAATCWSMILT